MSDQNFKLGENIYYVGWVILFILEKNNGRKTYVWNTWRKVYISRRNSWLCFRIQKSAILATQIQIGVSQRFFIPSRASKCMLPWLLIIVAPPLQKHFFGGVHYIISAIKHVINFSMWHPPHKKNWRGGCQLLLTTTVKSKYEISKKRKKT